MSKKSPDTNPDRRKFLSQAGALTAATFAAGAIGLEPFLGSDSSTAHAAAVNPLNPQQRRARAFTLRNDAARSNMTGTPANLAQTPNTDDDIYADKRASYTKGLPHDNNGLVDLAAYNQLVTALSTGSQADFNAIPLGAPAGNRKLTNPQAGFAFEMEGSDGQSFVIPPAPAFNSREEAGEIAENYWMALLRDVAFTEYATNPIAIDAAAHLNSFGLDFKGPKQGGVVTPDLLFRGPAAGATAGPLLSQFFWLPCFFGTNEISQRVVTTAPGVDYMTTFASWLNVQRGFNQAPDVFDPVRRYMRNGRDIGQWVHVDVLFQGYFQALLCLFGMGAPFDAGNPYSGNPTQDGFGTFGGPHIATLTCEVSTRALHAVWYQKWHVHRRLRPEVFAGRVHSTLTAGLPDFDVHPDILSAFGTGGALEAYMGNNGLLPMAFPEGSPTHPAYGAGHATVAGACTTILKAWFDESATIVSLLAANPGYRAAIVANRGTGDATGFAPVVPTADGLGLDNYTGTDAGSLTVGGELDKIAYNVANGRNIAGVHWRSDSDASIALGEKIAIQILKEQKATYNESFGGFSLTKFDGTTVTV
jgi:hypothetical protein